MESPSLDKYKENEIKWKKKTVFFIVIRILSFQLLSSSLSLFLSLSPLWRRLCPSIQESSFIKHVHTSAQSSHHIHIHNSANKLKTAQSTDNRHTYIHAWYMHTAGVQKRKCMNQQLYLFWILLLCTLSVVCFCFCYCFSLAPVLFFSIVIFIFILVVCAPCKYLVFLCYIIILYLDYISDTSFQYSTIVETTILHTVLYCKL